MKDRALTIYCRNGNTLRFEKVANFRPGAGLMKFDYESASRPGVLCTAEFYIEKVMGWSIDVQQQ